MTEPSGAFGEWKANAIGKKSKELLEFLEKKYSTGLTQSESIRLAIETLLEVVESEKSIELVVIKAGNVTENVSEADIASIVAVINAEKEEAEAAKKGKK